MAPKRLFAHTALLIAALSAGAAPATPQDRAPATWPTNDPALGERDWRDANDTVGSFERGHIDLLRWEAENLPTPPEAADEGPRLTAGAAVRAAFAQRPGLFASNDMSAMERARADVAAVELAREVQQAWVHAVAAQAALRNAEREFEAASLADELAARMTAAGNWGRDRLVGKRLDLADATVALAHARHAAFAAREALVRAAALPEDAGRFSLPAALPPLPDAPLSADRIETEAERGHPLLTVLAIEAERAEAALPQRERTLWHQISHAALPAEGDETLPPLPAAPFVDLRRTPLGHDAQRALRTRDEATTLAIRIRSQAREAWHGYTAAYEVAKLLRERALPLAAERADDMLLRYNGMLKSTWDLIDSTREHIAGETAALSAERDFWLAHINLQAVLVGAEHVDTSSGAARKNRVAAGGH